MARKIVRDACIIRRVLRDAPIRGVVIDMIVMSNQNAKSNADKDFYND